MGWQKFDEEISLLDDQSAVKQAIKMISKCGFDWHDNDEYETEVCVRYFLSTMGDKWVTQNSNLLCRIV